VIRCHVAALLASGVAMLVSGCGANGLSIHAGVTTTASTPATTVTRSPTVVASTTGDPVGSPTDSPAPGDSISPTLDPVAPSVDASIPASSDGLPPVVHRITTTDPVVFITIDDGYTKDPAVVELLRARHIPVTPFLAQTAINSDHGYFNLVQDASGQNVQDHSMSHPFLTTLPYDKQRAEICGAAAQYATWFGIRPWLFRPPYGAYNQTTRRAAKACGMTTIVLWDASLPHSVIRYANGTTFHDGDILLIHWRPKLAHDLAIAVDTIEAQGLRVAALQDYLPRPA